MRTEDWAELAGEKRKKETRWFIGCCQEKGEKEGDPHRNKVKKEGMGPPRSASS